MSSKSQSATWVIRDEKSPSDALHAIARQNRLHPTVVRLLAQRSFENQSELLDFLWPTLAGLPEPLLMGGMKKAVELVGAAITAKLPIVIWGDYDVDGVTATALLVRFFRDLGQNVSYCIPERVTHGYGLHVDLLQKIAAQNPSQKVLITVDCGISAHKEICAAQKMGFTVIVTDHHLPPDGPLDADAVVNPKQNGCTFPSESLAGVGIAFYFACGIRQYLRKKNYFNQKKEEPDVVGLLDLVALGTLADMAPLDRVNRILVREGLRRIERAGCPGVAAILCVAGIVDGNGCMVGRMGAEDIGFTLGPMINAAGRLGSAKDAVELFLTESKHKALNIARKLMVLNQDRKKIVEEVYREVITAYSNKKHEGDIVVARGNYHHGIIGIVASRIVEYFNKPVILFACAKNQGGELKWKGSGRSLPGINLHRALCGCAEFIERFGGHAMAAGLTVSDEKFVQFASCIESNIAQQLSETPDANERRNRYADLVADIHEVCLKDCMEQFQLLEPFGVDNEYPVFQSNRCVVVEKRQIGIGNLHLKLVLASNGILTQAVGFNLGHLEEKIPLKKEIAVIYSPMVNRYRETVRWETRIIDILFYE